MVTTDVAQLSKECNAWRETLRSYRNEFGQMKTRLRDIAGHQSRKDALVKLEHLDNQLHIQLINIHDLKQAIKSHERIIQTEMVLQDGLVPDNAAADHEQLYDDYQQLEHTLQGLRSEFSDFLGRAR